jgi:hypothetical protein
VSITKYRTAHGAAYIDTVEAEKETAKSIWVRGFAIGGDAPLLKRAKRSDYDNYFDTWADAKAFLLADAEGALIAARLALQDAQGRFGNVNGLKPPSDPMVTKEAA